MIFHDYEDATAVTAQYNWLGVLTGYVIDGQNTFVPVGNDRFRGISHRIEQGCCALRQPRFEYTYTVVGRHGRITGHDTSVGFVPLDDNNRLRQMLNDAIASGAVEDRGIAEKPTLPRCSHIKFCVFFPRPWPHLSGPFQGSWQYRSTSADPWTTLSIRLSNHPFTTQSPVTAAMSWLGVEVARGMELGEPLRQGLLEIEFSIRDLWSLFRSERRAGFGQSHDFIEDQFKMSLVRDDRDGDAPDTRTLIFLAPEFLRRAVIDVANHVAGAFNTEYGGHSVGFIKEWDLYEQHICLLRDDEGTHHLLRWSGQSRNSFNLSGEWRVRDDATEATTRLSFSALRNRLRALVDAGFGPEAISLANGFYELACRDMLAGIVISDPEAAEWVLQNPRFGYDRCRKVLLAALELAPETWAKERAVELLSQLAKIYAHRNAYMHNLRVVGHELTRSVDLVRETNVLLRSLLDAFETGLLVDLVTELSRNGANLVGEAAKNASIAAVRNHMQDVAGSAASSTVDDADGSLDT